LSLANEKEQSVQEQIQTRLEELKQELETGQAELQKVEMQRTYLRETMLRIEGAMHALGELLAEEQQPAGQDGSTSSESGLAATQAEETNV
jgi:predicted nuclease with TOPRIM domain